MLVDARLYTSVTMGDCNSPEPGVRYSLVIDGSGEGARYEYSPYLNTGNALPPLYEVVEKNLTLIIR